MASPRGRLLVSWYTAGHGSHGLRPVALPFFASFSRRWPNRTAPKGAVAREVSLSAGNIWCAAKTSPALLPCGGAPCAVRTLCLRCAKSPLFFNTGSHGSQGPEFCSLQLLLVHQGSFVLS